MAPGSVRSVVRRRPAVVQEVLRIIATKRSIERDEPGVMDDAEGDRLFAIALREWDELFDAAREVTEISEASFAELVIERLRREPRHGWDRILRGKAN